MLNRDLLDRKDHSEELVAFPLFDLPNETLEHIIANLSLKACGLFAQTSIRALEVSDFLRLLTSAVDAEPESYQQEDETKLAAIAILKRRPDLLFRKGNVTD